MKYFVKLSGTILVILVLALTIRPAMGSDQSSQQNGIEIGTGNQTALPKIHFDEMSFHIGTVNQHKTITHLFTFRNEGAGTLTIKKVKAG